MPQCGQPVALPRDRKVRGLRFAQSGDSIGPISMLHCLIRRETQSRSGFLVGPLTLRRLEPRPVVPQCVLVFRVACLLLNSPMAFQLTFLPSCCLGPCNSLTFAASRFRNSRKESNIALWSFNPTRSSASRSEE